jgi:quercetin dioxygenase-like cupin family protein
MEYARGRKQGAPSAAAAGATFTGRVLRDPLLDDGDKGEISVGAVIFEPGARTYWHSHAAGQTLLIVSGRGAVQTRAGDSRVVGPGDVVWAPPGEEHWHGAAPDTLLSHTAVSLGPASWAGEVDEASYLAAFGET